MLVRSMVALLSLILLHSLAWSKPHVAYKAGGASGIRTYKDRGEVGQVLFASKPISHTDKKPRGVTTLEVPASVDDFRFYVRFYYPETLGKIIKSIPNATRGHGVAYEIWIDNEEVWRASGEIDPKVELSRNTGAYHFDEKLDGRELILDKLKEFKSGTHKLTMWVIFYFDEEKPHPATGVPRFEGERLYVSMGQLELIKP